MAWRRDQKQEKRKEFKFNEKKKSKSRNFVRSLAAHRQLTCDKLVWLSTPTAHWHGFPPLGHVHPPPKRTDDEQFLTVRAPWRAGRRALPRGRGAAGQSHRRRPATRPKCAPILRRRPPAAYVSARRRPRRTSARRALAGQAGTPLSTRLAARGCAQRHPRAARAHSSAVKTPSPWECHAELCRRLCLQRAELRAQCGAAPKCCWRWSGCQGWSRPDRS